MKKGRLVYFIVFILLLFIFGYSFFTYYKYKNEVLVFQTKGKAIDNGIIHNGLIENSIFKKLILYSNFNEVKRLTQGEITLLDAITSNSTQSSIGTCEIDACVVYFGRNFKADKVVLITCNGNQLEVNEFGVFKIILLNEDQVNFINGLLCNANNAANNVIKSNKKVRIFEQ